MKISLNWLSDYIDTKKLKANLKENLEKLTMRGLEVESIEDLSEGFEKVIIAQIETMEPHPNADRLSVCQVKTGKEKLQIVCGAKNMKPGDKVALAQVGAKLPIDLEIKKNKIRGVESSGMLCAETELKLADESPGIMILPSDAPLGRPLAPYIGRDDIVFEVGVTPNRGDALSHIGVAREIAAILGIKVKLPNKTAKTLKNKSSDKIKLRLTSPKLCYQYHGRFIQDIKVGPSPLWLQKRLQAVGLRPINNIVDVTNFVLMEWGTPLHAFDYAKISGGKIQVRLARDGEKLPLLDDTEVTLSSDDLVIADAEKPVALAGVMGGGNSEVTESTTDILLEAAQFLPSTVRKTAKRYQKHTDSSHRFERQVDARAVALASERATQLMTELSGGKAFKGTVSAYSLDGETKIKKALPVVKIIIDGLNKFLGTELQEADVKRCLNSVGFEVQKSGKQLKVSIPSYRPDVEITEDIYEEVLRVWGYDKVKTEVPKLHYVPDPLDPVSKKNNLIQKIKIALIEQGFSEAVNFSFTSKEKNKRWGGPLSSKSVELNNPLNEDLTTMKSSLLGGLTDNLLSALNHQQHDVRLFEVRPVFSRDENSEHKVKEEWMVSGVMTGRSYSHALASRDRMVDFFDAKGVVETAIDALGAKGLRYLEPRDSDKRLHPAQTAVIALGKGPSGFVARLHPGMQSELKIKQPVYIFEFSLERALGVTKSTQRYKPVAKFPKVPRDLSLVVPEELTAAKVVQQIQKLGKPLLESVAIVDVYRGDKIPEKTYSLSVAMILGDQTRTLEDTEVDATSQKILSGLEKDIGVKLRVQ